LLSFSISHLRFAISGCVFQHPATMLSATVKEAVADAEVNISQPFELYSRAIVERRRWRTRSSARSDSKERRADRLVLHSCLSPRNIPTSGKFSAILLSVAQNSGRGLIASESVLRESDGPRNTPTRTTNNRLVPPLNSACGVSHTHCFCCRRSSHSRTTRSLR
jgi:hypothetical protein